MHITFVHIPDGCILEKCLINGFLLHAGSGMEKKTCCHGYITGGLSQRKQNQHWCNTCTCIAVGVFHSVQFDFVAQINRKFYACLFLYVGNNSIQIICFKNILFQMFA